MIPAISNGRVDHGCVTAAVAHDHWSIRHDGVDVDAIQRPVFDELGVVVHDADDPVIGWGRGRFALERRLYLGDAGEPDVDTCRLAEDQRMAVCIDESRGNGGARRIDPTGVGPRPLLDVSRVADRQDGVAADRHGLGFRQAWIHGQLLP